MIRLIGQSGKVYQWMAFHVALGVLTSFSKWVIIVWFIPVAIQSFSRILISRDKTSEAMYFMAYLFGMEILFRMAQTSPFIPYEIGKYGPILFIGTALTVSRVHTRTAIGFVIILLLIPSLTMYYGNKYFDDIAFNFFGMLSLGLAVQYFSGRIISKEEFVKICRTIMMPIVSILAYLSIRTPSISEIDFALGANFDTTGGFGSNQVATILGVALFILAICYFNRLTIFGKRSYDLILLAYIFARALLTFSRGGVIVSGLVILIYLFLIKPTGNRLAGFKAGQMVFFVILISLSSLLVNKLTNDALLLRYEGETQTTLSGEKEKDIDVITTGRFELFVSEVQLFLRYPILGVGPGGARYLRAQHLEGKASHSEFSRLLAENGIFGLIIIVILVVYPMVRYSSQRKDPGKLIAICFVLIALGMTFHAAMRTFATPFMYGIGLASLHFNDDQ